MNRSNLYFAITESATLIIALALILANKQTDLPLLVCCGLLLSLTTFGNYIINYYGCHRSYFILHHSRLFMPYARYYRQKYSRGNIDLTNRQRRYIELGIIFHWMFVGVFSGILFIGFLIALNSEKVSTAELVEGMIISISFLTLAWFSIYFKFIRIFQKAINENQIDNRWIPIEMWSEEQKTKMKI
ncbi:hypothetical protein L6260_01520 [Candidatus Parcubacteria bacterium]|nr:hypothetical protein [Candidatus Parcubacteria bacterium]